MSNPGDNYPKREIDLDDRYVIPQYIHNTPVKNDESGWLTAPTDVITTQCYTLGLHKKLFFTIPTDRVIAYQFEGFPKERR